MSAHALAQPPLVIIYGPTAGGKSVLAVSLALHMRDVHGQAAEIITADALQVYRGMDIGTAKPTRDERQGVAHHLIDIADPHADEPFTVDDWLRAAEAAIVSLRARGVLPIVVGGTSLYVQSLLYGLFEGPAANAQVRKELNALPPDALRAELARVDPAAAERIHPSDTRRAVRAVEVFRLTGTPISTHQRQWANRPPRADARLFILHWPVDELNRRINTRVKAMMAAGLLDEVRGLLSRAPLNRQAREALGYRQLLEHLAAPRALPLDDAVERIKIETRRFAKNQRTWMKRIGAAGGGVIECLPGVEITSGLVCPVCENHPRVC